MALGANMQPLSSLVLLLWILVVVQPFRECEAQLFVPSRCRSVCRPGDIQDVSIAAEEFLSIKDQRGARQLAFQKTRASTWAVALLRSVKLAVPTPPAPQTVTITPPAVARLLGVYSMAVYQAYAVWSLNVYPYGRYFAPITSDMVKLKDLSREEVWQNLTLPAADLFPGDYAPDETAANAAQEAAISGAAYTLVELFFCNPINTTPIWCNGRNGAEGARKILTDIMDFVGNSDKANYPIPFKQGADIAKEFFYQFELINLLQDNTTTLARANATIFNITTVSQNATPVVHQCDKLVQGPWYWQRLTVPRNRTVAGFVANVTNGAVFPPASYTSLPARGLTATPFFRGIAAILAGPALRSTVEARDLLVAGLQGPPGRDNIPGLQAAMREVLAESATLNDAKKVIAEFWADGPDSTTPPGHWYKIAIEESNNNAAFALQGLNVLDTTIWATLHVGLAVAEAGVLTWEVKVQYMGARPITGIQCNLTVATADNPTASGTAWRGPYLGVGTRNLSSWQPFQPIDFVTPPFSGYVSGHATFSAAAAEALRQLRSSYNTTFTSPGYNCYQTPRGFSGVEGRTNESMAWHVPGVTDRANRGPRSPGFSPARDVIMCWQTYDEAAQQAAMSRIYGGIHIRIDNDDGLRLGKRIGENIVASLARLSPANFLVKAPITYRPPEVLGNENEQFGMLEELVCPPGTYLRSIDGRADAQGLYALGLTCSDGTYIGTLGSWGVGGQAFDYKTVNDGFASVTAGIISGSVVAIQFNDTQGNVTAFYGVQSAPVQTSTCNDGEHLVGLSYRGNGRVGNIGCIGLLCGDSPADTFYRTAEVPSAPDQTDRWMYDLQCPDGMFITRFFGKADDFLYTLTAQCARSWNLRDVGIPGVSLTVPSFTHSSSSGYSGIVVKNYTGGIDSIAFISLSNTAPGAQSPVFGSRDIPGPSYTLRCGPGDRIVGVFGMQDAYVVSIGLICGSGPFTPLAQSTKPLPIMRRPQSKVRIPGGDVIPTATLATTPAASLRPKTRITSSVLGSARTAPPSVGALKASPLHPSATSIEQPLPTYLAQHNAASTGPTAFDDTLLSTATSLKQPADSTEVNP